MDSYPPILLSPGAGFGGATAQPDAVGSPSADGYDAKAIARWDVAPYQTFTGTFYVGVVAFHRNKIDRVEFSVNGGAWAAVETMTRNPITQVSEYVARLRAHDFASYGQIELRAIAYPVVGVPRVLQGAIASPFTNFSLYLNADPDGSTLAARPVRWVNKTSGNNANDGLTSATAMQTIIYAAKNIQAVSGNCDNGIIYLSEEDHMMLDGSVGDNKPVTINAWLELRGAPGTNPANVRLIGTTNTERYCGFSRCKLSDLTQTVQIGTTGTNQPAALWWSDGVVITAGHRDIELPAQSGFTAGTYMTDCAGTEMQSLPSACIIIRNVNATALASDVLRHPYLAVNVYADDIGPENQGLGIHPDCLLWGDGTRENSIVYGFRVTNAGPALGWGQSNALLTDIAIVNCLFESGETQVGGGAVGYVFYNHIVVWHVTHTSSWRWKDNGGAVIPTVFNNLSVRNNCFEQMVKATMVSFTNEAIDTNHFVTGVTQGTNLTTGSAGYVDSGNDNYRPDAGSALLDRTEDLLVPVDALWVRRKVGGAIGAFTGSVESLLRPGALWAA